ncbi:carbohydrate esterase family 1 protein [Kockovaella imperatae]|uniref:feruloyl esterase n=1 Tax=Kockovaella imperatae TaxID=4999 RepID=A0A1Y1USH2_9TREE|nr:carbohydrate esterase family 1 protein [Kockovaella imperatae]ORX40577.1 carbohydrate esterase family 1 protein [Kockovaella imperatae]
MLLSLLFAPVASALTLPPILSQGTGCGSPLPSGQTPGSVTNVTIESGGLTRSYLVFVPPTYDPLLPTPLILSYHGGLQTAMDQLELDEFTKPYFNNDSFVIYPQGIDERWQGVPGDHVNDLGFTTDILNSVQSSYCLDLTKIGASGKSDGAGFVNLLACDATLSSRIAAFAPVSGAYYIDKLPCYPDTITIPCNASRSDVPILAFHGGADNIIAYDGGERKDECLPSIPHWIREWAARDGLSETNTTVPFAEDAVIYKYGSTTNCTSGGLVNLVYDSVNGHDWPSTQPNIDNTHLPPYHPVSFNATPMILDFFSQNPLPLWYLL